MSIVHVSLDCDFEIHTVNISLFRNKEEKRNLVKKRRRSNRMSNTNQLLTRIAMINYRMSTGNEARPKSIIDERANGNARFFDSEIFF